MPTDKQRTRAFNKEVKKQLKVRTRLQRDGIQEVQRILKIGDQRIKLQLARAGSDFQNFILPQIQKQLRDALETVSINLGQNVNARLSDAFDAGVDMIDKPLAAGGVQLSGIMPAIDRSQLFALQSFMTDKMRDVTTTIANQVNTELGLTAIGAQTPNDAINTIDTLLGKGRRRAITVVRTEVLRAYSFASQQRKEQAVEILPGLKKRWLPSGRTHAREHHEAARGQVRDVHEAYTLFAKSGVVRLQFPRDPTAGAGETINCGCESLPHMESWDTDL